MNKNHPRDLRRKADAVKALLNRPRCIICDAPVRHGMPGVRRNATTCGARYCRRKRWDWFIRRSDHSRRAA